MKLLGAAMFVLAAVCGCIRAGEAETNPAKVRRIPPPGVAVPEADRTELTEGLAAFEKELAALKDSSAKIGKWTVAELLPDVQIYFNAVHYALKYDEFFNVKEVAAAKTLLKQGRERAQALKDGKAPWTQETGLIVRGYVSKIDGSVQPYGLVIDAACDVKGEKPLPVHIWYHGRGENLSEVNFLTDRQKGKGEFAPAGAIVLHPYGRYCNANKFAGEIDTLEALDALKKQYPIDENRICVRGFSMGGAACWQFATHYTDKWCAANPGAGFAETAEFTHALQHVPPPGEFEQKLWHLTNCTDYALNLFNLPVVAYSGEIDGQKQAADIMARAMKAEGLELTHIIGPGAKHFYEKKAKEDVAKRMEDLVAKGRDPHPAHVKLVTYTTRYGDMFWVHIDALEKHWERAEVDAEVKDGVMIVTTKNVHRIRFDTTAPGLKITKLPEENQAAFKFDLVIDGQKTACSGAKQKAADGSWGDYLVPDLNAKHPGLQGPIDDAFMDSFYFVTPTGKALNEKSGEWIQAEMAHAIEHWRRTFRGETRVVKDTDVTQDMIDHSNLVLWGDPQSNAIYAKIAGKLPVSWTKDEIKLGALKVPAGDHAAVLIYPNPLNRHKYVVLNSGFTFREDDYLNNAKQVAKLPDWAILDVSSPATAQWPGKIVGQGFFDESWGVK
jgi:alpha/beta superfamily hydrolase